jgi:ferredoxin--NADP+ reductase
MSQFNRESVVSVRHWTDRLFSFRTTRAPSFRFRNGQFIMMGLEAEGRPLLRAYSLASANYEDELEFFSIKVPDGPLTSRLQRIEVGDPVLVGRKATGTLLIDNLREGRNLFLLGTGTGLAPFLSIVKDPETYERFERVVVVHGCRWARELAYGEFITAVLPDDEFVGESVRRKLVYYPTVTREPFRNQGRISLLLTSGRLTDDLGLPAIDRRSDRFMLCGSPAMLADIRAILEARGFEEGNHGEPGDFVIEKAFVEK